MRGAQPRHPRRRASRARCCRRPSCSTSASSTACEAIRSLAAAGAPVIAVDHRPGRARLPLAPGDARCSRPIRRTRRPTSRSSPSSPSARSRSRPSCSRRTTPRSPPLARNADRLARLPAAGQRLGRPRAAAAQAPPVRRRRGRRRRRAAHVRRPTRRTRRAPRPRSSAYPAVVKPGDPIPFKRALRPPRARVRHARAADRGLAQRRRLRAAAAGGHPRRRRHALDRRLLHRRRPAPRSGSSAGASSCRCRAASAPAASARRAGATTSSSRRSRCSPRSGYHGIAQTEFRLDSARRALQADGGEPAALAVARPRRAPAGSTCRASPTSTCSGARRRRCAPGRRTTAAAGSSPPPTCAPRGRRAPRCAARCARSGPHPVEGTFDMRDPLPAIVQASGLVTAPVVARPAPPRAEARA